MQLLVISSSLVTLNCCLGSVFLPQNYFLTVFDHLLDNPPIENDISARFVHYLRTFWRNWSDKLDCWNDEHPRTTNFAEGYHNGMRTSFEK